MSTSSNNTHTGLAGSLPVRIVRHLTEATLAVIIASYAIIICAQVFFRFVLNDSLVWSEELVRYGLLWGVMVGSGVASDRGAHVALNPLGGVLKSGWPAAALAWASGVLVMIFCAIVIYAGLDYINRLWFVTSPAAQIPMSYVFAALPIGSLLIIFFTLVHLISGTFVRKETDTPEQLS